MPPVRVAVELDRVTASRVELLRARCGDPEPTIGEVVRGSILAASRLRPPPPVESIDRVPDGEVDRWSFVADGDTLAALDVLKQHVAGRARGKTNRAIRYAIRVVSQALSQEI